jgi:hypothetical protein
MRNEIINLLESLGYEVNSPFEDLINALCIKEEKEQIIDLIKNKEGIK